MKPVLIICILLFLWLESYPQDEKEIEIPPSIPEINSCNRAKLGYGFEDSGMNMYVARPKIFNHQWIDDNTLNFSFFLASDCCGIDYTNYRIQGDTILLLYGLEDNLPPPGYKAGEEREYHTCLCRDVGCCYELDFHVSDIDKNKIYLIKALNVSLLIDLDSLAFPVGYSDPIAKSIYFPTGCTDPKRCLEDKIESAIYYYDKLKPLYKDLIENGDMDDKLRKNWVQFFKDIEAIKSPFLESKVDSIYYKNRLAEFEGSIEDKYLNLRELFINGKLILQAIVEE